MPEGGGSNIEVAHHLSEPKEQSEYRMPQAVEIAEAIVLAIVAITTAWSGYQAALWTGHQSKLYGVAGRLRVQAARSRSTPPTTSVCTTPPRWRSGCRPKPTGRRSSPTCMSVASSLSFVPAFEAWKKTDPLNNPNAPPGPFHMPEYRNSKAEESARLTQQSSDTFEQGDLARHHADDYVRETVMLATVLLLTAISQRFKIRGVRIGLIVVAGRCFAFRFTTS